MIITLNYPEVLLILWSFILGFVLGAGVFASFFYRERKRMMGSIKNAQDVTIHLSEICDNLVHRINLFMEELEERPKKRKK